MKAIDHVRNHSECCRKKWPVRKEQDAKDRSEGNEGFKEWCDGQSCSMVNNTGERIRPLIQEIRTQRVV